MKNDKIAPAVVAVEEKPEESFTADQILNLYASKRCGIIMDNTGAQWSIDFQYPYSDDRTRMMTDDSESHIFWNDVYSDIINGKFKKEDLVLAILKEEFDESGDFPETTIREKIVICDNKEFFEKMLSKHTQALFIEHGVVNFDAENTQGLQSKYESMVVNELKKFVDEDGIFELQNDEDTYFSLEKFPNVEHGIDILVSFDEENELFSVSLYPLIEINDHLEPDSSKMFYSFMVDKNLNVQNLAINDAPSRQIVPSIITEFNAQNSQAMEQGYTR